MHCRLWFWSVRNPAPRIIAWGEGDTIRSAAAACFAPLDDPGWRTKITPEGQLYLLRADDSAGYCCELSGGPGPSGIPAGRPKRVRERL